MCGRKLTQLNIIYNAAHHTFIHHLKVKNVRCGAKDGTNIEFPSIEIGNTLPIDRAHAVVKEYGADYDQFLVFKQVQYVYVYNIFLSRIEKLYICKGYKISAKLRILYSLYF